jgi:hypothetical protein
MTKDDAPSIVGMTALLSILGAGLAGWPAALLLGLACAASMAKSKTAVRWLWAASVLASPALIGLAVFGPWVGSWGTAIAMLICCEMTWWDRPYEGIPEGVRNWG